ncbi:MAG TPA: peptidylprolyl isomerase [Nitrospiraceae bacterium]|nr:peptidylprolyl isomerase [Nitrospiraceae bacterium]
MTQAKNGDNVQVHYTGTLEDGTVFDTSRSRSPLQFTLGEGRLIPGLEEAVIGMNRGDAKTVTIPPDKAYGQQRDELIVSMDRTQLPGDVQPVVGQRLEITQANDQNVLVTVTDVTESSIILDANHPLAGKALIFELELMEIG